MVNQLGVIGCGLIGGSFALALKQAGLVKRVVGYSKSPATTEEAKNLGVIDAVADSPMMAALGSEIVLVAVPVSATESTLTQLYPLLGPSVLVMDVGSTKGEVVAAAQRALKDRIGSFVPAHPIAGKEKSGVANAEASLFCDKQIILTPLPQTLPELVQKATHVWTAIGAQVLSMTPQHHDCAFAAVSHLPHLLAFACFSAIAKQPGGAEFLSLAGPGFRDFTRIAASEPTIWRDILLSNRDEILQQSQHLRHTLDAFEDAMKSGNAQALEELIRYSSNARSSWQMGKPKSSAKL